MSNYYSVRIGRVPGIYLTWKECEENVKGYSKAQYKKFESKEKAEEYIKQNENAKIENNIKIEKIKIEEKYDMLVNNDYNFDECVNVYTDGSCINNGGNNAIGGYGIYFDNMNYKNLSKKLKKKEGYSITNNRAELKAILETLKIMVGEEKEIIIHTDSMYCIQVLLGTNTYKKILEGKKVPNSDYIKKCHKYVKKLNIKFHHVLAHTNKQDKHSLGNDKADKLANKAIIKNIYKIKLTFGKYEGKTLNEIYHDDKKYLYWCVNNSNKQIHDIKLFLDTVSKTTYKMN